MVSPEDDGAFAEVTKVTVYLTKPSMSALYGLAAELGLSRTDALNRALGLYMGVLATEVGQTVSFDHPGGGDRAFRRLRDRKTS
jgi:hypothetical protein